MFLTEHAHSQTPPQAGLGATVAKIIIRPEEKGAELQAQNSTLQAGKVSSCMATVLLLPSTVTESSRCLS